MLIRPFSSDDYLALAELDRAAYPQHPRTAEELRHYDEQVDRDCRFARWVVGAEREVVAMGEYRQLRSDPCRFSIDISVLPSERGRGIGSALYHTLWQSLAAFEPTALRSGAKEDHADGVAFL